jgi:hypothetical protein
MKIYIQCNTTANQTLFLSTSYLSSNVATNLALFLNVQNQIWQEPLPSKLNITSTIHQWTSLEFQLLQQYSNPNWFFPTLQANDISYLQLQYDGSTSVDENWLVGSNANNIIDNSPANDNWALTIEYSIDNGPMSNVTITFLANGEIDNATTSATDLEIATALFMPTISKTDSNVYTFWKTVNWIYVGLYWTCLYDLGHITSTSYTPATGLQLDSPNMMFEYPSKNNIFINATLFDEYYNFLNSTVGPILGYRPNSQLELPDFQPVDNVNQATAYNTTFLQTYNCFRRQRRKWPEVMLFVLIADYTLFMSFKGLALWIAGVCSKRDEKGILLPLLR